MPSSTAESWRTTGDRRVDFDGSAAERSHEVTGLVRVPAAPNGIACSPRFAVAKPFCRPSGRAHPGIVGADGRAYYLGGRERAAAHDQATDATRSAGWRCACW